MAKKKAIKLSEARILVFLENSNPALHYVRKISSKLEIDYGYTLKILLGMLDKEWLYREKSVANPSRTYYHIHAKGREKLPLARQTAIEVVED